MSALAQVLMPKLGQAMAEGTIVCWHAADGALIEKGAMLVTIETDKASYDIEAPEAGTLRITVPEGQEVKVGVLIAEIGSAEALTASAATRRPADAPHAPVAAVAAPAAAAARRRRVLASPKAKRLADERGIDLTTVTATAADGVISVADVERAVAAIGASPAHGRAERGRGPLTGIRKVAARRLQAAWQTIPHIVQMIDVDATALLAARAALKGLDPAPTVNDLILHAAARVMAEFPDLNATVEGETLVLYDGIDVGFAVETPRGLVVPVIRNAVNYSVGAIAAESRRLAEAARAGRLGPEDSGNASFTVSNLGAFGIRLGTPVINLGEPLLVFVGAVEDRPVAVGGQVMVRATCTLSIAYDHRVADGAMAARFTRRLKEALEALAAT